ncbi:ERF family protein [Trichloromonas sp.]|uniref:ERF family protein n=1 Tax=Trichloromonas sp. TaxID=3069249 RepID=UPI002A381645|nr:ERF family protein [Trichloromonas sp.]
MQKSESIAALAAALAKAQAAMRCAMKDSENPHFRSRYADLQSIWEAAREPLAANGLSVVQVPGTTERGVSVETLLLHESGEFIGGMVEIPLAKMDAQALGSGLTYARRYSLAAVVGIAPGDDDDAESAVGRPQTGPQNRPVINERTHAHSQVSPGKKDSELHERIRGALRQIYGDDKAAALLEVERLTGFISRDGTPVAGVKDYTRLSGKRLEILAAKLSERLKSATPPSESLPFDDENEPF